QMHHLRQCFVLMTATPQEEMAAILVALNIAGCFHAVYGTPTPKVLAVRDVLARLPCSAERALVGGGSETDLDAGGGDGVTFLLRRTAFNQTLQDRYPGPAFDDLQYG